MTAYLLLTEGQLEHGSADIVALLEKALAEAGDDPVLRGQVLSYLAENDAVVEVREIARADDRATEAVALSQQGTPDDQRLAVNTLTWTQALRGRPVAHLVERYYALSTERATMARHPERIAGQQLVWRGEVEQARPILATFRSEVEEWAEAYALARLHLCELELRAGRWDEVERMLDDWAASPDSALLIWPMFERCRGLLAVGRGDVDGRPRWPSRAVDLADSTGVRWDWLEATRALGVAALLAKDLPEAVSPPRCRLGPHPAGGRAGPRRVPRRPGPGRGAGRDGGVRRRAGRGRRAGRPGARAGPSVGAARARSAAQRWSRSTATPTPTRPARPSRRRPRRTAGWASPSTRRGPCWPWVGPSGGPRSGAPRATSSSARSRPSRPSARPGGPTTPAPSSSASAPASRPPGGLTATERRVADLAVEGLANKEIARTLVVTVNTVEFHLRNAYAKLGIRSRVQLAARLQEVDGREVTRPSNRPLW